MKHILLGLGILLFGGCSVKKYQLFNADDTQYVQSNEKEVNIKYESKIMPDDILSIDIYNMNQKSNILGNEKQEKGNEYIVSADGTIYLPLLQEINVKGRTTKELSKLLTERYATYLKQPYAKVAIKNHKVYVLGEVNKQGMVPITGNTISIIEAIAASGGLTDYAVRDRVHVVSSEGGKYKIRTLDLSKLSTLNMKNIILKHNSIVYIEPRSGKALRVGVQDYLPILQVISSLASTYLAIDYVTGGDN